MKKKPHPPYAAEEDPMPYLFPNNTLYDGKTLDQTTPLKPLIIHNNYLENRYTAFLNDKKKGMYPDPVSIPFGEWNPGQSKRCSVIGIKIKMYQFWDDHGNAMNCTCIWVPNSQVLEVVNSINERSKEPMYHICVGAGFDEGPRERPFWRLTTSEKAFYIDRGLPIKAVRATFRVTEDAMLPVGFRLTVRHFVAGQYIKVKAKTNGKGFAGVMKRHHFSGGPAAHGSSQFHRRPGSIGTRKGAIKKGKKMAGHMGDLVKTNNNLYVYHIDYKNDLIYVHGSTNGSPGSFLILSDDGRFPEDAAVPFPSFLPPADEDVGKMNFSQCQITAPPRYKYFMDNPYPMPGAQDEQAAKKIAVRAAVKRA
jgi:large subunit ribosomal protein L3